MTLILPTALALFPLAILIERQILSAISWPRLDSNQGLAARFR